MRGIGTVILVGFVSMILFGLLAPALLEPLVEVVINDQAVNDHVVDGTGFADALLNSILLWAPLIVLGSAVASGIVWYFRRERTARRVRR